MATYNRSNVLKYAIESVRRSTFNRWELLVVDDASTDDTESVARSFSGDPRIRYIRLPRNSGDQSAPNNEGIRLARGRYVAFLNQDDLWFPDHLEKGFRALEESGSDWVFTLGLVIYDVDDIRIHGVAPGGRYDPKLHNVRDIPGCFWMVRKEVLIELGGWRRHRGILLVPSQDLLIRGYRAGKKISMVPAVTVVHFPTSTRSRKDCYLRRDEGEQKRFLERMSSETGLREEMLVRAAVSEQARLAVRSTKVLWKAAELTLALIYRACRVFGILPLEANYFLRYRRKGAFMRFVIRNRGLVP